MNGKGNYKHLGLDVRKRMLGCFATFCRSAPFSCKTFVYRRREVPTPDSFIARFKRDLVIFLSDHLGYFQSFSCVKIYYDNGQQMITESLHAALDFMLSSKSILYRMVSQKKYRLSQITDYVCALALVNAKYMSDGLTETDVKVFGTNYSAFKKNYMKHIAKKEM